MVSEAFFEQQTGLAGVQGRQRTALIGERIRWRLSLRTLLIDTTLIAASLGLIVAVDR